MMRDLFFPLLFLFLLGGRGALPAGPGVKSDAFGFMGPETFPIDDFITQLRAADLDGDGLTDLVVVNNSRSKINLLYNQTGRDPSELIRTGDSKRDLNSLPPDARFRIESIASEKRIAGLVVKDLNGDMRPDIAYYGDPKELVVQYNEGDGDWSVPKRWPIDDGQLNPNAMTSGDLNGDGLEDLVVLGESHIYWLAQRPDHGLLEPERIPFSDSLKSAQVLDIDGDGRRDLLLVNWDSPVPFRFRLQTESGSLGPELPFALPPIRSYWADDLDHDGKTEIVTIALNSGRAQVSRFVRRPAEPLSGSLLQGQFHFIPLDKTAKASRGVAWVDVNRDGRQDLLVTQPDSGQIAVYLQQADGSLSLSVMLPTLTGVGSLAFWEGSEDQPTRVYLLSSDERQIGMMRFDRDGHAPFPERVPMEGKPLSLALGRLKPESGPVLAVILDQDGKRRLLTRDEGGESRTQELSSSFKSNPSAMALHDVNQDGLNDLVILIPYEKIKLLLQTDAGAFDEVDLAPPGGVSDQPWFSTADVDGDGLPELLLAQRSFLRAVVVTKQPGGDAAGGDPVFTVKDQINGASSNSRIVAATALSHDDRATPSLFLLDAERKVLTLSERGTNGVWTVVRNIPMPLGDFRQLEPVTLGGGEGASVGLVGPDSVGWMSLAGDQWVFSELDGYETPIVDGRLNDVVSGDLNQDGRNDLVFLETAKNYLDLVIYEAPGKLVPANRWPVFEKRTFRNQRSNFPEPREALIVDLTGDGKNDLAVIVHDRILVYPQE